MAQKIKRLSKKFISLICMFTIVFSYSVITVETDAAPLINTKNTLSDSRPSTVSNHTITFTTPSGAVADDTIILTFDSAFDTSSIVFGDIDLTDDSSDLTLAGDCATTTNISAIMAADVLTLTLCSTAAAIVADSVLEIEIGTNATTGTNQIINPALSGCSGSSSVCDVTFTGIFGDTGTAQVVLIDGVAVSATVDEYLTFVSDDYAVGFGSWSGGATDDRWATTDELGSDASNTSPFQLTVSSNAPGGVSITAKSIGNGTSAGLYDSSSTNLISADNAADIADGTEGYALYTSTNTTLTENTFADETATGTITTANQVIATAAGAVSAGVVEVALYAAIATTTDTGSYSDTLVFVCTPTY